MRDDPITIIGSIVAGNRAPAGNPDLTLSVAPITATHSLIGDSSGTTLVESPVNSPDANGNLIGGPVNGAIDPLLGPLVYNGGPTFPDGQGMLTHALVPGSPAVDAGDPSAVAGMDDVPLHDQRGMPFSRVANGDDIPEARIDMGAFESQPNPLSGDYNFSGIVDTADYIVWRKTLGSTNDLRADGDGDADVDQDDYLVWRANFGAVLADPPPVSAMSPEVMGLSAAITPDGERATTNAAADFLTRVQPAMSVHTFQNPSIQVSRSLPIAARLTNAAAAANDEALLAWLAGMNGHVILPQFAGCDEGPMQPSELSNRNALDLDDVLAANHA
jgi:hypothetical protein